MTYIFKVFVILSILFSVNGFTKQGAPCELSSDGEGNITIWVSVTENFMEKGPCGIDANNNELWCRSDFGVYLKEECENDLDACYDKLIGTCRDKQFVLGEGIWVLICIVGAIILGVGLYFLYYCIQEEERKRMEGETDPLEEEKLVSLYKIKF